MSSANELASRQAEADGPATAAVETVAQHPGWIPAAGMIGFVLLGLCWFLLPLDEWLEQLSSWLKQWGPAGTLLFAFAYAVGTLFLLPGTPLTIAAGVAYGWWALLLVWVSGLASAALAFLISRYLLRGYIETLARKRRAVRAVEEAVNEEGWRVVALVRLSPVIPFGVQNYIFGVTRISLAQYLGATAATVLPGGILNVYLGVLGRAASEGRNAGGWLLLAAGLAATLFVLVVVTRKARKKLREYGLES